MAGIKEIRTRIDSVEQTLKITNAMYLISSSKLRKARQQLTGVQPFFTKITETISDILHHSPEIEHVYLDKRLKKKNHKTGYIVISGDKGLAGAYNHNVLKLAEQELKKEKGEPVIYAVGQVGRSYFAGRDVELDEDFLFTAQDPTMLRAGDITDLIIKLYREEELDEVYIIYTQMVTSMRLEPKVQKLLPLDAEAFASETKTDDEHKYQQTVTYVPSENQVLAHLVPGYVTGVVFGALVESFCSEQNARMTAMDSSTNNAKEMLKELSLFYNRARQSAITQEITEIVGGAQQKKANDKPLRETKPIRTARFLADGSCLEERKEM